MNTEFVEMRAHREQPPAASTQPRVVLSRLPRGASALGRGTLSLKFVLDGEERYSFGGRTYRIEAGQMLIVDAANAGVVTLPGSATGLCLYLPQLSDLSCVASNLLGSGPIMLAAANHPLGTLLTAAARRLAQQPDAGAFVAGRVAERAAARLSLLAASADERLGRLDSVRTATRRELLRRVEIARAWLHAHPDRAVPLRELAMHAGTSPFHLTRAFSAVHGLPPAAYHRNIRLDAVAAALRCGKLTAAEAARRLGFADQAGFTRAFKRRHGVTPGAFSRCLSPAGSKTFLASRAS